MKLYVLFAAICVLTSCDGKPSTMDAADDTTITVTAKPVNEPIAQIHTDTLQYLHFEGNYDYWFGVFIDAKKDTVQLVVGDPIPVKYRNKLVEVKWFADSLSEAGDGETKYAGKRLKDIRLIGGKLFADVVTDAQVIQDIKALPEVQANAEQVGIAERPTDEKEYYLVETGIRDEDHFSRLFMFRVHVYPKYEVKFYDAGADTELSLTEWRKKNQPTP